MLEGYYTLSATENKRDLLRDTCGKLIATSPYLIRDGILVDRTIPSLGYLDAIPSRICLPYHVPYQVPSQIPQLPDVIYIAPSLPDVVYCGCRSLMPVTLPLSTSQMV